MNESERPILENSENSVDQLRLLVVGSFRTDGTPCGITTAKTNYAQAPLVRRGVIIFEENTYRAQAKRSAFEKAFFGLQLTTRVAGRLWREKIDAVDIHTASGPDLLKHIAVVLACRIVSRPVLLRIHGGDFENNYRRAGTMGKWVTRWALRRSTRVVALSEGWADKFTATEPATKLLTIPNSVNCDHFESLGEGRQRGGKHVLMLANLCEDKGHFTLIAALPKVLERHPECQVQLAGAEREEGARTKLESLARELGVFDHIEFCGPVSGTTKDELFRKAAFFVLPSHIENMPVSIVEAMASGLAVVATKVGAIPEMVEHGKSGILIDPKSVEQLAEAMSELLDDPEACRELGEEGRSQARQRWDQDAVARLSVDFLHSIVRPN